MKADRRFTTVATRNRQPFEKRNLLSSTGSATSYIHPLSTSTSLLIGDKDGSLSYLMSPRTTVVSSSSSNIGVGGSRSWKSTMASIDYDDDDGDEESDIDKNNRARGHAEAATARASSHLSHDESWMINLGRDDDNEWLLGPRDPDVWFTGMKPTICPGK